MQTLFSQDEIAGRVAELGREISSFYQNKELTLIVILNGAIPFAADLMRHISIPMWVDSIAVQSYCYDASSGQVKFRSQLKLPVENRHILVVDDILDTGLSLQRVKNYLASMNPASVRSCVMVQKQLQKPAATQAEWVGFSAPDSYLVGYGLDSNENGRNLPYIGLK